MRHATPPNPKPIPETTTTERKREEKPKGSDSLKSRSPAKSCGPGSGMHMPRGQVDRSQCRRDREKRAACDSSTSWVSKPAQSSAHRDCTYAHSRGLAGSFALVLSRLARSVAFFRRRLAWSPALFLSMPDLDLVISLEKSPKQNSKIFLDTGHLV